MRKINLDISESEVFSWQVVITILIILGAFLLGIIDYNKSKVQKIQASPTPTISQTIQAEGVRE